MMEWNTSYKIILCSVGLICFKGIEHWNKLTTNLNCASLTTLLMTNKLSWLNPLNAGPDQSTHNPCQAQENQPKTALPKLNHLAIIMDGNRRWAKERGLSPIQGHIEGVGAMERTIKFCLANGIKTLSLYAFSIENLQRSEAEKEALFKLVDQTLPNWENLLKDQNVKISFVGNRELFPTEIQASIKAIEDKSTKNTGLELNILFCYGGQQEIVDAAQKLALLVEQGQLKPSEITPERLKQEAWTGKVPAPDIIFRPGNRQRISNFFTFDAAYSEIKFSKKLWPEITSSDLDELLKNYHKAERTFGC